MTVYLQTHLTPIRYMMHVVVKQYNVNVDADEMSVWDINCQISNWGCLPPSPLGRHWGCLAGPLDCWVIPQMQVMAELIQSRENFSRQRILQIMPDKYVVMKGWHTLCKLKSDTFYKRTLGTPKAAVVPDCSIYLLDDDHQLMGYPCIIMSSIMAKRALWSSES